MTIRLSPLPSPRRTLPALALVVGLAFVGASAALPRVGIARDATAVAMAFVGASTTLPTAGTAQNAGAFTGRYEQGLPVYRLAPIEVSAARGVDVAARGRGRDAPHVDAVNAECTAPAT
jgi:hypothetical protein